MNETSKRRGEGVVPPAAIVEAVRALVAEGGELAAAERLGVGASTVVRLRAGLTVRAGTIALVEKRLAGS